MTPDPGSERFYETEAQAVFRAVYLLCRDRVLAEDATQEAFARALERWERLGTQPWAGGWVMTTALNVTRRGMRHRRVLRPVIRDDPDPEETIDLWDRVKGLPRRQQEAVVLCYRVGLSIEEVAQAMGCKEGTVRTHLSRARKVLRAALKGVSDGD
ncbi:MAG: sigma-70 family RNA polymerase sigma factor [Actinobacteria bacterium]|nr:sigma-70 family RNA polymerase sigma factor [Actinomycetota bacterium]